jgi:transcriptional regulator with XRE-family HTH domain
MAYQRINPISVQDQKVLTAIGNKIYKLREATGLSLERFCSKNDIPRISYSNLEAGKNFHMTTLLKVLAAYKDIESLNGFFSDL